MKNLYFVIFISLSLIIPVYAADKSYKLGGGNKVTFNKNKLTVEGNGGGFNYGLVVDKNGIIQGMLNGEGKMVAWDGTTLSVAGDKNKASLNTKTGDASLSVGGQNFKYQNGNFNANGQTGEVTYDVGITKDGKVTGRIGGDGKMVAWNGTTLMASVGKNKGSLNTKTGDASLSVAGQNINFKGGNFSANGQSGEVAYELGISKDGKVTGKMGGDGKMVAWDGTTLTASVGKNKGSLNTKTGDASLSVGEQNFQYQNGNFNAKGQAGQVAYDISYNKEGGITGMVDAKGNTVSWNGTTASASGKGYDVSFNKETKEMDATVKGQHVNYQDGNIKANGNIGSVGYDISYTKDNQIEGKLDVNGNTFKYEGGMASLSGKNYDVTFDKNTGQLTAGISGQQFSYQKGNFNAKGNMGGVGYDIAYSKEGGVQGKIDANGNLFSYESGVASASGKGYNITYNNNSKSLSGNIKGQNFSYQPGQFSANGNVGGVGYDIAYNGKNIVGKVDYKGNVMTYDGNTIGVSGKNYSYAYDMTKGAFNASGNAGGVGYGLKLNGNTVSAKLDYKGNSISYENGQIAASGNIGGNGSYSVKWDGKGITAGASFGGVKVNYQDGKLSFEGSKLISSVGTLLTQLPGLSEYSISSSLMKSILGNFGVNDAGKKGPNSLDDVIDEVFGNQ